MRPVGRVGAGDALQAVRRHGRTGVYGATSRQFYTGNASRARGPGCSRSAASTPASGGPRTSSWRTGSTRPGCGFVFNPTPRATTTPTGPFASWLRTARDYGVNEVVFGRRRGPGPDPAPLSGTSSAAGTASCAGWPSRACAVPVPRAGRRRDRCERRPRRRPGVGAGSRQPLRPERRVQHRLLQRAWPSELGGGRASSAG